MGVLGKRLHLKVLQNSQGKICAGVSFLRQLQDAYDLINKETPAHKFFCEFSETFRGHLLARHKRTATSECSEFHNFSEMKTLNYKSKGNTCTSMV